MNQNANHLRKELSPCFVNAATTENFTIHASAQFYYHFRFLSGWRSCDSTLALAILLIRIYSTEYRQPGFRIFKGNSVFCVSNPHFSRRRFAPPSEINTIGRHLGRFASALAILLPDSIENVRKSRRASACCLHYS